MPASFKEEVYQACLEFIDTRIAELEHARKELTEGAENDSKSSAGDKHETARAMMQLEHEKISRQLEEALRQKNELERNAVSDAGGIIHKGSLIETNQGFIYLSVAIGKISVNDKMVIALSPASPLGQKLLGIKKGDAVQLNQTTYKILGVA